MKNSLTAVIYLEPDQVSLRIIELPKGRVVNDVRSGALALGNDKIANYAQNMAAIVNNLNGFKQQLKDYQVQNVHFYGAIEDLAPIDARYVADQLEVRTGLKIQWLNNNQLMAKTMGCVVNRLAEFKTLSKHCLYLLTLGLDSMTLAFFHHGNFEKQWEIDLGGAKISRLVQRLRQTTTNPQEIIQDYISSKLEYISPELKRKKRTVLLIQNAPVLSSHYIKEGKHLAEIPQELLSQANREMEIKIDDRHPWSQNITTEQERRLVIPNYLVIARTAYLIHPLSIFVTDISMMDGLVNGFADSRAQSQINTMIRTSADDLAQRYGVDTAHRDFVTRFALQFFDQLRPLHRLDNHARLLLEIASKVDDIGNFINQQSHYRHSAYILKSNPLIGLSDDDNQIIAEVARYHSSEAPTATQEHYRRMDDDIQLIVAKLVAILRLVDALDDSRQQKISSIKLNLTNDSLLKIKVIANNDLVLEKWSFSKKSELFSDVFGIKPVLIERGGH
ncbi:MAG: exopolyphosphatase [Limosilactobacillus pontis]|uniref:Exopolyphosphatase n=1 Tax=Limosilactobacillus pontis TaxID=35787 RepID=A0A2J6NNN0_9LACO|nr:exopolyphosphatase [Limosilactobacillus pontis]PMB82927.1 exopolyphosphatase [Limosilactobacillus pontis]